MKNQCTAFTKDHRRCRLEKVGEKTCVIHRNYYRDWFIKHPLYLFNSPYMTKRRRNEVIYQLQNHIHIDKNVLELLRYTIYPNEYEFLIKYAYIDPLLIEKSFKLSLIDILWTSIDDVNNDRMDSILTSYEVCIEVFKYSLELFQLGCAVPWPLLFKSYKWKQVLYSDVLMDIYNDTVTKYRSNLEYTQKLENCVLPYIIEAKMLHRKQLRSRIALYKEDLMMFCWHPSRVEKWISDGGMELCDMMMGV